MTDERVDPPFEADERATLTAFLDFQRDTLALKCEGLTDDQLRGTSRRISPGRRQLAPGKSRGLASLVSVIS